MVRKFNLNSKPVLLFVMFATLGILPGSALAQNKPAATREGGESEIEFTDQEIEFFENKIRPLLVEHCLECHGDHVEKLRGGLWLTSRAQMLSGGDSGPAIVLGKPEESLLIESVHYDGFEMPPSGQLADEDINLLERWIEMGAPDPRQPGQATKPQTIDIEAGREFWSFQPVDIENEEPTPSTAPNDWARTPIDFIVLDRLEQADLTPVPDADRATLLRRVHLTLTGLPPSPDEIEAFTQSKRSLDQDLSELVDRLLASEYFGQRWGRHWLDAVRFAESSGGGRSLMFPEAWRFRDYVIDSFNQDKPFDQLIREHVAGDLLPYRSQEQRNEQLVASGFLTLGPTNYEQQDKERLRLEVIDEQVDTIGRAFLAMTLGCARCHDHKFDPIPMTDYYALAGIFGSTQTLVDGNVSSYVTHELASEEEKRKVKTYQQKLKKLNKQRKLVTDELKKLGSAIGNSNDRVVLKSKQLPGIVIDNVNAQLKGKWTESVSVQRYIDQGYLHDLGQPKGKNTAVFEPKLDSGGRYEVRIAYSPGGNRASNTLVIIDHQDGQSRQRINQSQPGEIDGLFTSLGKFRFEADNVSRVTISNEATDGVVIVDAVQFLKHNISTDPKPKTQPDGRRKSSEPLNKTHQPSVDDAVAKAKSRLASLDQQLIKLKKSAPRPLATAMSVKDTEKCKDGYLHIRGSVRNLGEIVPRGFLQVVTPKEQWPAIDKGSGRLELASWIADPANPLTARVYVNRVWRHLFGQGLVRTPDNFGTMGSRPTHQALLDHLAIHFVQNGWSTKSLIREIMRSRVYRLATIDPDEDIFESANEIDPENQLLWRANRRRVDAEVLRDTILSISGQLDLTHGGRTIRKLSQYDLGYEHRSNRRSVYVPAFRNALLGLFEVFDIANPNMVVGDRNTSTLPTQALFLMNDPWVIEQSKHAAQRLCQETSDLPPDQRQTARLKAAYLRIIGRPPTNAESKLSIEYLKQLESTSEDEHDRWSSIVHALFGSLDFRYIY